MYVYIYIWSEIFGSPTGQKLKSEAKHGRHGGPELRRFQSSGSDVT